MTPRPTVISLFSGGGGLDLGLAAAGFDILYESDIDQKSCNTLAQNGRIAKSHGLSGFENSVVKTADIRDISGSEILEAVNKDRFDVDVLSGGPPCQAFSVFGKRKGTGDQRGQLSFEYRRILGEIAPRVFVFENVAGILTVENGETYKRLLEELSQPVEGLGYRIFANRLNAQDYCVPQSRDRVIIIGVRSDVVEQNGISSVDIRPTSSEDGSGGLQKWRTVNDAFRSLPPLKVNSVDETNTPNHHGRRHSDGIIERYANLGYGERDGKTRINKLYPDKPSFTIVVGSDAGGGKGHVHPFEPREVTPRESARIQTFPDWWFFTGTVRDEIRQVGNAVPALLGFEIGNTLRKQVFNLRSVPLKMGLKRLGQEHLFQADLDS